MTAQNLHIKIYSNLLDEIEKLVQILSKDSDIKEIDEYRLEALSKLEGIIKEVKENIKSLEINSEWYKFTIGFYGETNAGKSTLIETGIKTCSATIKTCNSFVTFVKII
jgi:ribosome biogenesis GTPase A